MFNNISNYEIDNNNFIITCNELVNYQDLTNPQTMEILNNYLHSFDSNLQIKVKLTLDKSNEVKEENIIKLKETFGNILIIK